MIISDSRFEIGSCSKAAHCKQIHIRTSVEANAEFRYYVQNTQILRVYISYRLKCVKLKLQNLRTIYSPYKIENKIYLYKMSYIHKILIA